MAIYNYTSICNLAHVPIINRERERERKFARLPDQIVANLKKKLMYTISMSLLNLYQEENHVEKSIL